MEPFQLTVGSDPEFMVVRDGRIRSAIPIMGQHDKEHPLELRRNYKVFADNVNLEMNIPPAYSADEFCSNFRTMFTLGNDFLRDANGHLHVQASHEFDPEDLLDEGAMVFGCRAEQCSYLDDEGAPLIFEAPDPYIVGSLRSCGGHVHIGRSDFKKCKGEGFLLDFSSQFEAVKFMDIFVGLPLTFVDKDPTNMRRKRLYGKPGSFRPTPFGVEWRAVSNFWTHHPDLVRLTFDLTDFAINYYYENPDYIKSINPMSVFNALNSGDQEACWDIFNNSPVSGALKERVQAALNIEYTGAPTY